MTSTTSVRFPKELGKKLRAASAKANTDQSDIIRVAVAAFLEAHRTADAIITAVIESRKKGL